MASRSPTGARRVRRGGLSIRWRLTAWYAGAVLVAGLLAAMSIGGVAGLYPAFRAARLPTEALRA